MKPIAYLALSLLATQAHAGTKISELADGSTAQPGDTVPAVRSGSNVKVTLGSAASLSASDLLGRDTAFTATAATVGDTLAKHFSREYYAQDFGARCDGTTDDTAAIQAGLDALHSAYPEGAKLGFPRGTCIASQVKIWRNQILSCGDGPQACTLKQKAASNRHFLISEGFASLTGTGAIYGTNPNVPSWFGIEDMHVNGNASNQSAGNYDCIAWYGNATLMLGTNIVENCKRDGIYTESAGGYAYSLTDWKAEEEGFYDHVISRQNGRYGWLNRGPHDSVVLDYIGWGNGSTGYRSETSGTTYIGSAHIVSIHTYANLDGTGMYFGSPSTIGEAYSDFDNVTLAAPELKFGKLYQIQCGYLGKNCLEVESTATYNDIGVHSMTFYQEATDVVGVNVKPGGGIFSIGHSEATLVSPASGTLYKVRSNFVTINAVASNIPSGKCFDVQAAYVRITGQAFSCQTALAYGGGNNNVFDLAVYGGTNVTSGSFDGSDVVRITADTGSTLKGPGFSVTSPYDSSGNFNFSVGNAISGYYLPGYQTQATFKGAEANDAYAYQAPTNGFAITVGLSTSFLILDPAGTLASGTITMPSVPVNGQKVSISSTQAITSLTLSPNAGQSVKNAPTTLAAGSTRGFIFGAADSTWYPVQ